MKIEINEEQVAIIIEAMQFRANELKWEHSLNGMMEPINAAEAIQEIVGQIQEQFAPVELINESR